MKSFLNSLITLGSLAKWLDSICVYKWFIKVKSCLITFFSIFDRLIWVLCVSRGNMTFFSGLFFYLYVLSDCKLVETFKYTFVKLCIYRDVSLCNHRFVDSHKKVRQFTTGNLMISSIFVEHIFFGGFHCKFNPQNQFSLNYENLCHIMLKEKMSTIYNISSKLWILQDPWKLMSSIRSLRLE